MMKSIKVSRVRFYRKLALVAFVTLAAGVALALNWRGQEPHGQEKAAHRSHERAMEGYEMHQRHMVFHDVKSQTERFITYYQEIQLTPEQEGIKQRALGALQAPCCDKFPMLECCCVCNVSRSIWGLTGHLIAERGYDEAQVRSTVGDWLEFINPAGFSGNACPERRCAAPFHEDGCGGMDPAQVVY